MIILYVGYIHKTNIIMQITDHVLIKNKSANKLFDKPNGNDNTKSTGAFISALSRKLILIKT